ncbi:MAG: TIGR00266 family protein [Chloroflexota bacterium]|nr:TIGR00266 family protein [Chloroflexota bacterium]
MEFEIVGSSMQTLLVELSDGEAMYTERGGMAWLSNVDMDTSARGGLMKGLGRMVSGESLFMTTYTARRGGGKVAFTPEAPGKVLSMKLEPGQAMLCQRDAFMCAEESVDLSVHLHKRFGAGLFGGEGFFLQEVEGPGYVFFEIPGEAYETTLAPGEVLHVDPGHLALFEPNVDFSITRVKGVRNVLLGGEGLFLAKLTGPGNVWLQSLPLPNLAAKLNCYISKS